MEDIVTTILSQAAHDAEHYEDEVSADLATGSRAVEFSMRSNILEQLAYLADRTPEFYAFFQQFAETTRIHALAGGKYNDHGVGRDNGP